ncbi:MAG: DUF2220 family protein [Desulfobulbaceae bacterium]|jgi:hypothetical protein|nr:DUF2220 family protein [Desulfobulbaceae bacterium]
MSWTSPNDLKTQVEKLWLQGKLLATMITDQAFFPRRLIFKSPTSKDLNQRYNEVRNWVKEIRTLEQNGLLQVTWSEINHRVIGKNRLPTQVWLNSLDDGLILIGKQAASKQFAKIKDETDKRQPKLLSWLEHHPMKALASHKEWSLLLDIINHLQQNPRPNIYIRQLDLPNIHSKFIEQHRGILTELLDLTLPAIAIKPEHRGIKSFCKRYGFSDKPELVRFRILDPNLAFFTKETDQDITISKYAFTKLNLSLKQVFITENEINFLTFPNIKNSLVIWGQGYGFTMLSKCNWLRQCQIHYWGDIDSHGFAILDQLRSHYPHSSSLLMDQQTLLAHRDLWGRENKPVHHDLPRLTAAEAKLYNKLRNNDLRQNLRLEQEHISYSWLNNRLNEIAEE